MNPIKDIADKMFRKILNDEFCSPDMTLDNTVIAIQENISLWETGKDHILARMKVVPSFAINMAGSYVADCDREYGGIANLALMWLQQDHPDYFSVIINTPGGEEWFETQVLDILKGIGVIR